MERDQIQDTDQNETHLQITCRNSTFEGAQISLGTILISKISIVIAK